MKIIADDKIPFLRGALEPFSEVIYIPGKEITRDLLSDADAMLVRTRTRCSEQLLRGTDIRFIGTATIGFDHIDTQYCEENGIKWTNAPGCNSSSVQQYIAAALSVISSVSNFRLSEKTMGIIGVGNVGSKVANLARTLGMNVLLNDPPRARREGEKEFVSFERILREADIVSLHVPLTMSGTDKTYHLFDDLVLKRLKKGSWFFNTSRGEVVDTEALKHGLRSAIPAGAVIDVWENEPDISQELMSLVSLATPHIAGYSTDGKANGTAMVVNSLCSFFNLPLKNWFPDNIPPPFYSEIVIDGTGRTDEDVISEAILHTYNIKADDQRFRGTPSAFEKLRGDYPLRREFPSFSVRISNSTEAVRRVLEMLGFMIIE